MERMGYDLSKRSGLNFGIEKRALLSFVPKGKHPDYYHKTTIQKTRPSRRRVVSVSARSETSPSHESVDSTQRRPTRPRIGVDSVDSALWWFYASSQFNVEITTLTCIYECSLCNLLYCACILICFYRVYLYFCFMFSMLGDMFWTCDTWMWMSTFF